MVSQIFKVEKVDADGMIFLESPPETASEIMDSGLNSQHKGRHGPEVELRKNIPGDPFLADADNAGKIRWNCFIERR